MRHPICLRRWLGGIVVGCIVGAVTPAVTRADPSTSEAARAPSRVEQWLELQRSRSHEAPLRRMPSEAAILVYARYLEGFLLGPLAVPRREAPRDGD